MKLPDNMYDIDPAKDQSIKMREARTKAQAHDMTKEEFRAQTPPELRGPEQDLAATPRQQWQPIETAPKGGSILAYQKSTVFIATYAEYHDGNPCWRDEEMFIAEPTHWMPLPEPPCRSNDR